MQYILNYGNGNISISKIIEADTKEKAIDLFIEMYDSFDITKNEVDVIEHMELKEAVNAFFDRIKK